mgnify:FL=1
MQSTTKLESINTMLTMIGASPVSTLDGATSADTSIAVSIHDEVSREIQSSGWHYNREYEVELAPDTNKFIYLDANVLQIDVEPRDAADLSGTAGDYIDVVQRGNRLYDKKDHTYEFSDTLKATVVYGLDWDALPQPVKQYITARAGRVFCDRMVGSGDQHSFNQIAEGQALLAMRNWDAQMADSSIFDNWDVYRIINRHGVPNSQP